MPGNASAVHMTQWVSHTAVCGLHTSFKGEPDFPSGDREDQKERAIQWNNMQSIEQAKAVSLTFSGASKLISSTIRSSTVCNLLAPMLSTEVFTCNNHSHCDVTVLYNRFDPAGGKAACIMLSHILLCHTGCVLFCLRY